ncbi:glycoside hydrolase family 66 protein [Metabacillus sp. FJAT-52054]|uniref:Glycoside hydrolase family 66 protein n=1 Tax=Metabacillus sediminis TaxID=3117746 RepID=A0ABZ2NJ49_9BACI
MKGHIRTLAILILTLAVLGMFLLYFSLQPKPDSSPEKEVAAKLDINKARFAPGETVSFSLTLPTKSKQTTATIRYYHLDSPVDSQTVPLSQSKTNWDWSPPKDDYRGYLAETVIDGQRFTIGIDVSSDWSKFPRYGFLSDFSDKASEKSSSVLEQLNRYHINGLQFYDWQYKHHNPLKTENGGIQPKWEDIANREVSVAALKDYIASAQKFNMQTMAYNLIYGTYEDAGPDGVKDEWRVYKDENHAEQDIHPLPEDWKSNVYLLNSGNPEWQQYILSKQNEIYQHLAFDGWHIDQLGPRGQVYDYDGNRLNLEEEFDEFLHHGKSKAPDKSLVMNAVNQYGQKQIGTTPVDFMYTEVWDEYKQYKDLKKIIDDNADYSDGKNTVLAAYMNYNLSKEKPGNFNVPGVLLANSVIFSSGGSHLELGEHMLSSEYFPNENLNMTERFKEQLLPYYDFLVAYQNLLRGDGLKELPLKASSDIGITSEPEKRKVWGFSKSDGKNRMIHMINFTKADSMEWRDTEGTQPEPDTINGIELNVEEDRPVKKVWAASPDSRQAAPVPVHFSQKDENVAITVPSLTYWTMLVMEY